MSGELTTTISEQMEAKGMAAVYKRLSSLEARQEQQEAELSQAKAAQATALAAAQAAQEELDASNKELTEATATIQRLRAEMDHPSPERLKKICKDNHLLAGSWVDAIPGMTPIRLVRAGQYQHAGIDVASQGYAAFRGGVWAFNKIFR